MWMLRAWLSVGVVTLLAGGMAISPAMDSDAINYLGWALLAAGGIITQVGVIGLGVFIGLRAHDSERP